ncbi:V-type proton ATPase 16 kDa proteolipid subunit c1 c3 c5 [Musa troglodytarum]|uniref:V-type proton ATPase proteolipid subunit n=1 Tax=Musa troglodytarum TaxID=320322 RepID=A0A9E7KU51_9LILI|nr:V-type proton ATPase 16 kDa proteolipid subunit c1 c3 c5 [Musa troglodytarum]
MSTFTGDETAPFFGFLGAAAALVFSCMGAAYGTAKSGVGVASMGVMRPELVMKSIVPVVMAGVLGIYGLIIAVIISTGINPKAKPYYLFDGYAHLSSGLACGLAGLSAGMAIGIVGDAGVRANAQQPKLFVGMILILIFAEALALYGLIVGIILSSRAVPCLFNNVNASISLYCRVNMAVHYILLFALYRVYSDLIFGDLLFWSKGKQMNDTVTRSSSVTKLLLFVSWIQSPTLGPRMVIEQTKITTLTMTLSWYKLHNSYHCNHATDVTPIHLNRQVTFHSNHDCAR